ncbi:MAG TPA: s-methyl-5-thioribose-1-phosphate isomerase, partial [Burkholderiaceae bacterium]|nr:s-methyl-5-thioribose-1-phosphate isomerase [Burkholderiaceae bacterium]
MKVQGKSFRSIWPEGDAAVGIVDQRFLPFEFVTTTLVRCADVAEAVRSMQVRGAPLIGVAGAYGLALAMREASDDTQLARAYTLLLQARPTAVNLRWALDRVCGVLARTAPAARVAAAWQLAATMADEDVTQNRALGSHGARLLQEEHARSERIVNVLTHCNAGWLGTVDYGTALSAIYQAFDAGVPLHVWVDETRPRNQGLLTAWELAAHGVPHTLIADNTGGHLMQHGQVDVVIVGADRVSRSGDV